MGDRVIVKAVEVASWLRQLIEEGDLATDTRLPSERVISEKLQTSRVTTREALKMLETQGLIYRSNRRGWFVTPPRINYDPSRAMFFMDYVAEQGFKPFSQQISKKRVVATAEQASFLSIAEGEHLVELKRVRGANNRPVYVETILLPERRLPGIFDQDIAHSVTTVLKEQYDKPSVDVELEVVASSLEAEAAELLQAPTGYTSLEIHRVSRDAQGELVEYDVEHWRHDALKLKVALNIHD